MEEIVSLGRDQELRTELVALEPPIISTAQVLEVIPGHRLLVVAAALRDLPEAALGRAPEVDEQVRRVETVEQLAGDEAVGFPVAGVHVPALVEVRGEDLGVL